MERGCFSRVCRHLRNVPAVRGQFIDPLFHRIRCAALYLAMHLALDLVLNPALYPALYLAMYRGLDTGPDTEPE